MGRAPIGEKLLQVWQWGPPAQAETTIEEAIQLCKDYGATGLLVKAIDGVTWMGHITQQVNAPEALRSLDDVRRQARKVHDAGLYYAVWTNPLGLDIPREATLTGQIAGLQDVDAIFLDVEPYDQFWGAWRAAGLASDFIQRVRGLAPDAYIVMQPDPRPLRFAELRPEEWLPHVDAVAGQHYFSTFQTDPIEEVDAAVELAYAAGKANFVTFSASGATAEDLQAAVDAAVLVEVPGIVLWRMGVADAAQLRAFASFTGPAITPPGPTPIPDPDPGPLPLPDYSAIRHDLATMRGELMAWEESAKNMRIKVEAMLETIDE